MSATKTRIMYIERGGGLAGPGRIGRVSFSKTGRTVYYHGRTLRSLNGCGYKTTHFDTKTGREYWISGPRKDGQDTFYPGEVKVDEDVREEYWTEIRKQPTNVHLKAFRSLGKHAKHSTR
jgi:hypothetical protein